MAALLPWPVGVVFALLIFAALHWYAGTEPPVLVMQNPAGPISSILGNVYRTLAGIFKYLIPGVLLLGACASFVRRRRQKDSLARVAADPTFSEVSRLGWAEFEGLVAEAFRQKGYRVVERGGAGPDGGVDLELHLGKDRYLVQCKHWRTYRVGVAVVRELYGAMAAEGAAGGFVVASGDFTADAKAFAKGRSIQLVDARALKRLVGAPSPAPVQTASVPTRPACPLCGSAMVRRHARRGAGAGEGFWGCSQYPKCRGTRS